MRYPRPAAGGPGQLGPEPLDQPSLLVRHATFSRRGVLADGGDHLAPVLVGDASLHQRLDVAVVALPRVVERAEQNAAPRPTNQANRSAD